MSSQEEALVAQIHAAADAARPAPTTIADIRESADALYRDYLQLPGKVTFEEVEGPVKGVWGDTGDAVRDRVLFYCHGGGFAAGSPTAWRVMSGELGRRFKMRSFSVDYRLAPEHPFPAGLDDCLAAYRWLLDQGFPAESIVFAGDSGGAGLIVSTMLRARAEGLPQPCCAYLMSPWVDLTLGQETQVLKAAVDPVISQDGLEMFRAYYLNGHDPRDPLVSPMFADMTGLPPVLIHAGSHEVMLDEIIRLARQFAVADVFTKLEIWPGMHHEFQVWYSLLSTGRKALDQAEDFVREALGGTLTDPPREMAK